MGCGNSKGEGAGSPETDIRFEHTGVFDVDRFFDKVKNLMDSLKEATAPYEEALAKFYDATDFY